MTRLICPNCGHHLQAEEEVCNRIAKACCQFYLITLQDFYTYIKGNGNHGPIAKARKAAFFLSVKMTGALPKELAPYFKTSAGSIVKAHRAVINEYHRQSDPNSILPDLMKLEILIIATPSTTNY